MYRLQCIKDGMVTQTIELDSVQVIPPGGHLLATLPADVPDSDLEIIRRELQRFFGDRRNIAIARAGDLQFVHFPTPPGVSDEGAAWAMEAPPPFPQCSCMGQGGRVPHDPHCPASPEYWKQGGLL